MDLSTKDKKNLVGLALTAIGVLCTVLGKTLMTNDHSKMLSISCSTIGVLLAFWGVVVLSKVLAQK